MVHSIFYSTFEENMFHRVMRWPVIKTDIRKSSEVLEPKTILNKIAFAE
jgi:hypothetical protein